MNCKPGDLAVIVHCPPKPDCVGRIVECVKFFKSCHIDFRFYTDVWVVEWHGVDPKQLGFNGFAVPDAWLRPIRDPGDDAVDEVIQRLGVPHGVPA